jgi:hypothetical protein
MTANLSLNRSDLGHTGPSLTCRANDLAVGHERPSFEVPRRLVARASAEPNATFKGS